MVVSVMVFVCMQTQQPQQQVGTEILDIYSKLTKDYFCQDCNSGKLAD